tara:strand:+ start:214 stop:462 length:249 start_codon:yes stop_codon:yes gene_type:complete
MRTKEKAKELVERFIDYTSGIEDITSKYDESVAYRNGIECALVMVEEIIRATAKAYWYDVKKELLSLRSDNTDREDYPLIED